MTKYASHSYGDFVKHGATGDVGIILDVANTSFFFLGRPMLFRIKWHNAGETTNTLFDFDLISEWEYCSVTAPERCGQSMADIEADALKGARPNWFTNGYIFGPIPKTTLTGEDWFQ